MNIKDLIQKFEDIKTIARDISDSSKSERERILRLCDNVLLDYKVEQHLQKLESSKND